MRAWLNLGCLFLGQAATVAGMAALALQIQEELSQPWLLAVGLAVCFALLAMFPGKWLNLRNGWHVWLLWASAVLVIAGLGAFLIHPLCVVLVVPALAVALPLRTA